MSLISRLKKLVGIQSFADAICNNDLTVIAKNITKENIDDKSIEYKTKESTQHLSPLDFAILKGAGKSMLFFLEQGADFAHLVEENGECTVEVCGIYDGDVLRFFFDRGVNLNTITYYSSEKYNLLNRCARWGEAELLQAVADFKYDFLDDDRNPYFEVLQEEPVFKENIRVLIRAGIDYNKDREELIMFVLRCGVLDYQKAEILQVMIEEECQCDMEKRYIFDADTVDTVLGYAVKNKHRESIAKLIELGADITPYRSEASFLMFKKDRKKLVEGYDISNEEAFATLSGKEIDAYIESKESLSGSNIIGYILTGHILTGTEKLAQKAIDKGADVNAIFDYYKQGSEPIKCSALYALCLQRKHFPISYFRMLLNHGAKDIVNNKSALFCSVEGVKIAFLKCLLEHGVNPNTTLENGDTDEIWINHFYSGENSPNDYQKEEILEVLMQHGLDINLKNKNGESALDIAISNNDVKIAEQLIERFSVVVTNQTIENGFSNLTSIAAIERLISLFVGPITISAKTVHDYFQNFISIPKEEFKDQVAIFAAMVRLGLDLNASYNNKSVLQMAMEAKDIGAIAILLNHQDKLNIEADIIPWAVEHISDNGLVANLVRLFPDYEEPEYFKTDTGNFTDSASPIALALALKKWDLASYLLEQFPGMRAHNSAVNYLVDVIGKMDEYDHVLIEKLLDRDPDINRKFLELEGDRDRFSLLVGLCNCFANTGSSEFLLGIEQMLKKGASTHHDDIHIYSVDTSSPIHPDTYNLFSYLMFWSNSNFNRLKPLYDLLIKYGAEPQRCVGSFKESSLTGIVQRQGHSLTEEAILQYIQYIEDKTGFDINEVNSLGNNLVTGAAMAGKARVVKYLAERGVDVNHVGGFDDSTPIHKCISNWDFINASDRVRTVETLIELGVEVDSPDPDPAEGSAGSTPLMTACSVGVMALVERLLELGANINHVTAEGNTALLRVINGKHHYDAHHSLDGAKARMVAYLLEHGANPNTLTDFGLTLLTAAFANRPAVFKELLEGGANPYIVDPDLKGENGSNIGFIKEKRADENGMNTIGFLLSHDSGAAEKYVAILEGFLGKELVDKARKDLKNNTLPKEPKSYNAEFQTTESKAGVEANIKGDKAMAEPKEIEKSDQLNDASRDETTLKKVL